ncbi:unnamed protein product [Amaranthus hypochondriacus]
MASSKSMDDKAFSDRVKKTFGSLFASLEPSPASSTKPLWSLTDAQVEKKEWRRDKDTSDRDSNPCSSSFNEFLSQSRQNSRKIIKKCREGHQNDLQDVDDDEDEGGDDEKDDIIDWDVKSSIGLDSTLDNEEEEDNFDKVAIGRENAGDRLYMSNVTAGHDSHFITDDFPGAVGSRGKDPRANRWAAIIRLKEDDAEAAAQTEKPKPGQPPTTSDKNSTYAEGLDKLKPLSTESLGKLKPILKRKEIESTSKPSKRVRFDPAFVGNGDGTGELTGKDTSTQIINQPVSDEKVSKVPDYMRNPSSYTRYSLDSTDEMSNKSNTNAYMDFAETVNERSGGPGSSSDVHTDLPKSVTFVPKKKSDTSKAVDNEDSQSRGSDAKLTSVQSTFLDMASNEQESEVGDMEVDEPETNAAVDTKKQGRQYRTKPQEDEAT